MASAPKKNAAARAASAPTKSNEAAAAPRAVFVMPQPSAKGAETASALLRDAFSVASPAAEIQQSFRSALEKSVAESARGFRQGQDCRR